MINSWEAPEVKYPLPVESLVQCLGVFLCFAERLPRKKTRRGSEQTPFVERRGNMYFETIGTTVISRLASGYVLHLCHV